MLRTKTLLSSLILILSFQHAFSQGQGNTPYSVFGYGELADPSAASQDMMGGTGASFANAFYVNLINPALLVKNRYAANLKYVAFDVGLRGNSRTITSANSTQFDLGMNLTHLSLTTPITQNWAMAVALRPYSMVDHKSSSQETIVGSQDEIVNYENSNTGGISRVSYVNSFRVLNDFYIGIEGAYNFGTITKDSSSYLFGLASTQLRNTSRYTLKGTSLKLGVAYQHKLSQKWRLNVGGSTEISSTLKGDLLKTFATYSDQGQGPTLATLPDTVGMTSISASTPAQFRAGVSLESPFKWVFAADYHTTRWSNHKALDKTAEAVLTNTEEYKFGIEWLPNSSSTKYLNQVFYRVGFATGNSPYFINNTQVKDSRFSFGMSLPMGFRNPSYVNLGMAVGTRGTTANNLIQEQYIRFSASMSLLSPWFIKPKID
ncbi:hypothetical protein [Arcticibacterium luteifluviistationis]|uniref:Aromatic hydrocarbon degradation protein n=1 Tax=Arcticibacterium luteifluviistationis TaxID=1784714 RepID=A0A2Z4G804_9BACT|nr:hypothetical protein [Arcticibacterium luteifluviistationis]AWV97276.1 hypothetical protein DJ013_03460 [Arcticibacterium luteifluviistationis]